jgi:hypothetical protein
VVEKGKSDSSKTHMSGDEDPTRSEIKATEPLVVRGVTKKSTSCRAGR